MAAAAVLAGLTAMVVLPSQTLTLGMLGALMGLAPDVEGGGARRRDARDGPGVAGLVDVGGTGSRSAVNALVEAVAANAT